MAEFTRRRDLSFSLFGPRGVELMRAAGSAYDVEFGGQDLPMISARTHGFTLRPIGRFDKIDKKHFLHKI